MRQERLFYALTVLSVLVTLCAWVGLGYVAIHFIGKYW